MTHDLRRMSSSDKSDKMEDEGMKLIIAAPRGKMASLIVADAAGRDNVEIVAGIGPKGRDYIGKDIGEAAMTGKIIGAPVVDDIESVIDEAEVVCDFSTLREHILTVRKKSEKLFMICVIRYILLRESGGCFWRTWIRPLCRRAA